MHEHHITNEVVHRILHACEDEGIDNPKKIVLSLGLLTGYKQDSVLFYFEGHKHDISLLKNASLEIIEVDGKIHCNDCKKNYDIEPLPMLLCPKCSSSTVKVLQGNEIKILKIE